MFNPAPWFGQIIQNQNPHSSFSSSSAQWRANERRSGPCQNLPLLPMCWASYYLQSLARKGQLSKQSGNIHKECRMVLQGTPCPTMMNEKYFLATCHLSAHFNHLPSMVYMEPKKPRHSPNCSPMLLLEPLWRWETFQRSFRTVQLLPCTWWPFRGEQKPGRRQCFVLCVTDSKRASKRVIDKT